MIIILFKKIISTALAIAVVLNGGAIIGQTDLFNGKTILTADAATVTTSVVTPITSVKATYGNKVEIKIENAAKYKANTVFQVFVSNKLSATIDISKVKANKNVINLYHNGNYFRPSVSYSIQVKAVNGNSESALSTVVKAKTKSKTYYNINKSVAVYTVKSGKMVRTAKTSSVQSAACNLTDDKGTAIAFKRASQYSMTYLKITEGTYKGKYVKIGTGVNRISEQEYKRRKVTKYAKEMNGGRYVYGGSSYKATDCSGLTMLSYSQVGVSLPHSVTAQATKGKAVSLKNIKAGDILILNNSSHAAMYIGDNKMVHAMNSRDGIKIQSMSYLQYYKVNSVRRIIV